MSLENLFPKFFVKAKPYNYSELPKSNSFFVWFWFFIEPKWLFFAITLKRIVIIFIWALAPLVIQKIIDIAVNFPVSEASQKIEKLLLVYLGLIVFSYVLQLGQVVMQNYFNMIKRQFSLFAFKYIVSLPTAWHELEGTGNKLQRIVTARNAFFDIALVYFYQGLDFVGTLLMALVAIIITDTPLIFMLYLVVYIVGYVSLALFFGKNENKHSYEIAKHFEQTLGKTYEFASSIVTVKSLSLLPFISKNAWKKEMQSQKVSHKLAVSIRIKWFVINNFRAISFVLLAFFAWHAFSVGSISIGIFTMILLYKEQVANSIVQFAQISEAVYQKSAEFMRVVENLKQKTEQLDEFPSQRFPKNWKELSFKSVGLSYKEKSALSKINLTIPRGQKVALVGRSGAGKTTFMKLLLKLMNPTKGSIYFDGVDMRQIKKTDIASNISVVLQDTELFNISIKENVLIQGKAKKDLKAYLKMAYADGFVSKLPEKENTIIGERGVKLSGGEKQRIGIARALAQESDIIVFDEATSALDTESEKAIQKAMHTMFKNKTAFIIAHRLSTIKEVDRILVFDKGRIVEDGSFEELLKKDKIFAKLWRLQKLD